MLKYLFAEIAIQDGENQYTSPVVTIIHVPEEHGSSSDYLMKVADLLAAQFIGYEPEEINNHQWVFNDDYRFVKAEKSEWIQFEHFLVLKKYLQLTTIDFPQEIILEGNTFSLVSPEGAPEYYQHTNSVIDAVEALMEFYQTRLMR